jgi:hypothetical protein
MMHGFNVKLEKRWDRQTIAIWFWRPGDPVLVAQQADEPGLWKDVEVERGARFPVEPSLELPVDLFEQLVGEASDFFPPSAATDRHLKDAVEVRDRLLALVEKGVTS